jgi:protein-L-isoaspartate(D-aspartate) O-methyltransferase
MKSLDVIVSPLVAARQRYADLIRQTAGLRSDRLVRALSEVPREDYLGLGPWKILKYPSQPPKYEDTPDDNPVHVYDDVLVALDLARRINNGMPSALTKWIDALDIRAGEHVVHAGCGTGYYTAIIAHVVGNEGRVTAIEFDSALAARAQANLRHFPYVEVIAGDATSYETGGVDVILINAGATHPCALWLDSLNPAGRLVFPLVRWPEGSKFAEPGVAGLGVIIRVERAEAGYRAELVSPVGIFPCLGALDTDADQQLAETLASGGFGGLQSLRRDTHERELSRLLHGKGYCFSNVAVE